MIRYLIMDVDGTLTDGKIYMGSSGEVMKSFSIKDGYAIAHLSEKGIEPVILTGRNSKIVANRAEELSIKRVYQGISDKEQFLKEMIEENSLNAEQIAYIGDDDNDLECMKLCGCIGCPADASKNVKQAAHFVSDYTGGNGAVRQFIDWIAERE